MEEITLNEYLSLYLDKLNHDLSNLANFAAIVYEMIPSLNWVGFYLFNGNSLYLGPFQGKAARSIINLGEGVCGKAAQQKTMIVVDDVHKFEGHIACDDASNSEIVIPIEMNGKLYGVLDIDSPLEKRFDEKTISLLQEATQLLVKHLIK